MIQEWFTAQELALLTLPSLPNTKRGINRLASAQWQERRRADGAPLSRRRRAKGGGQEYHYSLLPAVAISALAKAGLIQAPRNTLQHSNQSADWLVFEALPKATREKAEARLRTLKRVEALKRSGMTKKVAVAYAADEAGVSSSTIFGWFKLTTGKRKEDWLPALAPRQQGRTARASISSDVFDYLKSDYLRPSRPCFESCFIRLQRVAEEQGWKLPSKKTLHRRIMEIPESVRVLEREGQEALERMFPPLERDRSHFHALEAVNADGHKWDVFVKWSDGSIGRPLMMAIQDLHSGKILGWRVDKSENADLVRLTFGDVFRNWGIPQHVWLDNGRGFASKWITGGSKTRFRFKVKEEDPAGVLTAVGCQVHWTRPYRGQSKPIERAFRDLCEHVAKDPRFEGAYTGNKVDAKPENYASRAVPIEDFLKIASEGIALHNARPGRRTHVCRGVDSFDTVFARSYEASPIVKASPAQLRMCLLAAEKVSPDKRSGAIRLFDNRYWAEFLPELRGQKLVARFDPERLAEPLEIYRLDGSYVGAAELQEMAGFDNLSAAREHERKRRKWLRAQKDLADAEARLKPVQVAAMLPDLVPAEDEPEAGVIRLATIGRGGAQIEEIEDFEDALERGLENIAGKGLRVVE